MTLPQAVDLTVGAYLLVSLLLGLARGAVREFFGLLAVLLPVLVSLPTYFRVAILLQERTGWSLVVTSLLSFVGIFVLIAIACRLFAGVIERRVRNSDFFASFNRTFGAGIGLLKAAAFSLVAGLVFLLLPMTPENTPPWAAELKSASLVLRFAGYFVKPATEGTGGGPQLELYRRVLSDPAGLSKRLEASDRFRAFVESAPVQKLFANPKLQAFVEDPAIKALVDRKDYVGLIQAMLGPRGRAVLDDPAFMKDGMPALIEEFQGIVMTLPAAAPTAEVSCGGRRPGAPRDPAGAATNDEAAKRAPWKN